MKVNNPAINREKLLKKFLEGEYLFYPFLEYFEEIGFEDSILVAKLRKNLTQKEIIEFYYKLK